MNKSSVEDQNLVFRKTINSIEHDLPEQCFNCEDLVDASKIEVCKHHLTNKPDLDEQIMYFGLNVPALTSVGLGQAKSSVLKVTSGDYLVVEVVVVYVFGVLITVACLIIGIVHMWFTHR